jgi:uncharacterized membrane protein YidH (DUF202 family)
MRTILAWSGGGKFVQTFLTTIAGIVIAAIIGLLTISDKIPPVLATGALYGVLFLSIAAAIVVVGYANYQDFREIVRRGLYMDAVPTLVVFKHRSDKLTVTTGGDAVLEFDFRIQLSEERRPREFLLPVFSELGDGVQPGDPVTIESITVDGRNQLWPGQTPYEPLEVRSGYGPGGPQIEYGAVRIPLSDTSSEQRIRVRLKMAKVYAPATGPRGDVYWADIPYVTEEIEVAISSSPEAALTVVIPPPLDQALQCGSALWADEVDLQETSLRGREYSHAGEGARSTAIWTTKMPKLGYRYKLRFGLVPLDASGADDASRRPAKQ